MLPFIYFFKFRYIIYRHLVANLTVFCVVVFSVRTEVVFFCRTAIHTCRQDNEWGEISILRNIYLCVDITLVDNCKVRCPRPKCILVFQNRRIPFKYKC